MAPVSGKLREIATQRLTAALSASNKFVNSSGGCSSVGGAASRDLVDYVSRLEAAMFGRYSTDADNYKDQVSDIVRALKPAEADAATVSFLSDVHEVEPEALAVMAAEDMVSRAIYSHRIEEQERREKEHEILPENDLSSTAVSGGGALTCPVCGKVKLSNINMNRCGVEDSVFGKQFENNFEDNRCECTEQEIAAQENERKEQAAAAASATPEGHVDSLGKASPDGFLMPGVPASFSKMVSGNAKVSGGVTGVKRPRED